MLINIAPESCWYKVLLNWWDLLYELPVCVQTHNFCPSLMGIHQIGLLSFDGRKKGKIQHGYLWVGKLHRFNQLPSTEQHNFYQGHKWCGLQHYAY